MNLLGRCASLAVILVMLFLMVSCGGGDVPVSSVPPVSSALSEPESIAQEPQLLPLPLATDFDALTGLARSEGMLEGQRPVAVMVSNDVRSLPQRGLSAASVLVEMETEGGITRLMAMYSDYRTLPQVGPVRSTRDQFVQMAYPTNAIMSHIGTSVYARNLLQVLDYESVDGIYLGENSFWFDDVRGGPGAKLNEYCWFTDAGLLWTGMEYLDIAPTADVRAMFNFSDEPYSGGEDAAVIYATFSDVSSTYFTYDAAQGVYVKMRDNAHHTDEDGTWLVYDNLFLLSANITLKPDGLCTEFDFSGGDGYYFSGGKVYPIMWQKGGPAEALRMFDASGEELRVAPGKSYMGIISNESPTAVRWEETLPTA